MQKISLIIPFYNEEGNVIPLYDKLKKSLNKDFSDFEYEIIMVNDGSRDKTWDEIKECSTKDKKIIGLKLNRNYGQSVAMDAGFQKASGDIIVTLDGDGQNDPEDIKKLFNKLIDDDLDIVAGWREKRKDPLWMIIITKTARFLRKVLINDGVRDSGCTLRVYRKDVVSNLYLWAEMHRYIIAIAKINGFKIGELKVNHMARVRGKSKYNWTKSIKGLIDLFYIWFIAKYNSRPLHLFGMVGFLNTFLGIICLFISFYDKLFTGIGINRSGWLMMGLFLVQTGIIIFIFGMQLDIMIRNYYNNSRDKRYIVREEIGKKTS